MTNNYEKVKLIACRTLKSEIEEKKPSNYEVQFIESGYHRTPDGLRSLLQSYIDNEKKANTIVFGYGLCSNGLSGLHSRDKTLVIPRVHDCIGILLGSREKYNAEFSFEPGTYYLSRGWIEELREPLAEYREYVEDYGEEMAKWFIDMQYKNYTRLVFIYNKEEDKEKYYDYAKEVSEFLGTKFELIKGEITFFEKLFLGDWEKDTDNFLVVPPGEEVKTSDFL